MSDYTTIKMHTFAYLNINIMITPYIISLFIKIIMSYTFRVYNKKSMKYCFQIIELPLKKDVKHCFFNDWKNYICSK